jgi:mRNA cleavage and polyadenylation factor CLP1 P-loop
MTSTSGFPFAPAYLNLLRSGPPVEEPSSKKRSKVKKATFISASVGRKLATKKAKAAKMKIIESASITPVVVVESEQSPVESTVLNTKKVNLTELKRNGGYESIQSIPPPMRSEYCENRKFHSYSSSPSVIRFDNCCYSLIVAMSKGETKAVSGFCFLSLLKGQVSINGHNLKTGVRTEVINPSWQPAAMVVAECSPNTSSSKKASFMSSIESTLESAGLSAKENLPQPEFLKWLNDSDCLVLLEGIPIDSQEWLLAAEDQSLFQEYSSPSNLAHGKKVVSNIDGYRPKYWWTDVHGPGKENIFGVVSAIIGEPFSVTRKTDIELLEYMPSWISSVDEMISDSSQSECAASRTVICGAKGVGKSTCLRYTVNRLLSMTDAVAVIDCDLGQPEFTVPGMLSLHIVTGPILSPTHMHLTEPLLSYFIGDLTSRNEPEHFARALYALMAKYTTLQDKALKEELNKRKEKEEKGGNSFSLLSEKKVKLKMTPLPLVVNTDGSVRYMGAEVLIAVMKLVNPTHVLHISSEKDRDLPALDSIRGPVDCSSQTNINTNTSTNTSTSASASSHTSKKGTISSSGSSDRVSKGPTGCRLFTLDPGRLRPSKIHSVDLRSLR